MFKQKQKESPSDRLVEALKQKNLRLSDLEALLPKKSASRNKLFQETKDDESYGDGPLHIALRHFQSLAVIDRLLSLCGPDVRRQANSQGDVPLHIAAAYLEVSNGHHQRNIDVISRIVTPNGLLVTKGNGQKLLPFQVTLATLWEKLRNNGQHDDDSDEEQVDLLIQSYLQVFQWFVDNYSDLLYRKDLERNTLWHYMARIAARVPIASMSTVVALLRHLVDKTIQAIKLKKQNHPWNETNNKGQTPWNCFQQHAENRRDFGHLCRILAEAFPGWDENPMEISPLRTPQRTITSGSKGSVLVRDEGSLPSMLAVSSSSIPSPEGSRRDMVIECGSGSVTSSGGLTSQYSSWDHSHLSLDIRREEGIAMSASMGLSDDLVRRLGRDRPYDAFILHAGEQKFEIASTLVGFFEESGFRCFIDYKMKDTQGAPAAQMEWALETCRYCVVLLSRDFVAKKHPCAELDYAFRRAEWFDSRDSSWRSLQVILYDMTVDEYSHFRTDPQRSEALAKLPALERRHVVLEWLKGAGKIEDLPKLCEIVSRDMRDHDETKAVQNWIEFLESWSTMCKLGLPRVGDIYD